MAPSPIVTVCLTGRRRAGISPEAPMRVDDLRCTRDGLTDALSTLHESVDG